MNDTTISTLTDESKDVQIEKLENLLNKACDDLIWCSGSYDFAPEGKARIGWNKGPRKTIDEILELLPPESVDDDLLDDTRLLIEGKKKPIKIHIKNKSSDSGSGGGGGMKYFWARNPGHKKNHIITRGTIYTLCGIIAMLNYGEINNNHPDFNLQTDCKRCINSYNRLRN